MASYHDRVEGVLLGTAVGDALGAPYEFQPPRAPQLEVAMVGGGAWAPGEWTDDTSMAIAIAEVAATGVDLRDAQAQDAIVSRWLEWSQGAKDVGIQTRSVLQSAANGGSITAASTRAAAEEHHRRTDRSGGNGSLMRTAPVALAYLDDEDAMVEAARAISELTHHDPDAGDACVLWCAAIRHAVLTGELDVRVGLGHIASARQALWAKRLDEAEAAKPADFPNNGWVVTAMQAAWSAIATTPAPHDDAEAGGVFRADHLRLALDAAVRAGYDTDTVAAIAGGVLGAVYGASAIPSEWRRLLHGWPNMIAHDLAVLAAKIERGGKPDLFDYSYRDSNIDVCVHHPYDDKVLLGGIGALRNLPQDVDAVVSLCRVSDDDIRRDMPHVEVRLIDQTDPDENPHLDYVLLETVRLIEQLRREGRTVLVHCVAAYSRTPSIGALYGARLRNIPVDEAVRDVTAQLPTAYPNRAFREALRRIVNAEPLPRQPTY